MLSRVGLMDAAGSDGRVENVEHFLRWLFVSLLRKADARDEQHGEKGETKSVVGFHVRLLRKQR